MEGMSPSWSGVGLDLRSEEEGTEDCFKTSTKETYNLQIIHSIFVLNVGETCGLTQRNQGEDSEPVALCWEVCSFIRFFKPALAVQQGVFNYSSWIATRRQQWCGMGKFFPVSVVSSSPSKPQDTSHHVSDISFPSRNPKQPPQNPTNHPSESFL